MEERELHDKKFIKYMSEIEKRYKVFGKHERIRIEQWSNKLCQITVNNEFKKNRNLYCMLLLDCVLNGKLIKPFIQVPTESYPPVLSKAEVLSQLSIKFKEFERKLNANELNFICEKDENKENNNPQLNENKSFNRLIIQREENQSPQKSYDHLRKRDLNRNKPDTKIQNDKDISYNTSNYTEEKRMFDISLSNKHKKKIKKI